MVGFWFRLPWLHHGLSHVAPLGQGIAGSPKPRFHHGLSHIAPLGQGIAGSPEPRFHRGLSHCIPLGLKDGNAKTILHIIDFT